MLYASVAKFKTAIPIYSSIGDALILIALESKASEIDSYLQPVYTLPVADAAAGSILLTLNPGDGKKITCGATAWTFKTSPTLATDVQIGGTLSESLANFLIKFSADVVCSGSVSGSTITFTSRAGGTPGNSLALSSDIVGATVSAFAGGAHDYNLLVTDNIDLAAEWLNLGQEKSSYGNAQTNGFNRLADQARKNLESYKKSETILVDALGIRAPFNTEIQPLSNTSGLIPFADEGPPEAWDYASSKIQERESSGEA